MRGEQASGAATRAPVGLFRGRIQETGCEANRPAAQLHQVRDAEGEARVHKRAMLDGAGRQSRGCKFTSEPVQNACKRLE